MWNTKGEITYCFIIQIALPNSFNEKSSTREEQSDCASNNLISSLNITDITPLI